jgi:hypothetical protein
LTLLENEVRVELRRGENATISETEAMYERARKIAAKFGMSYFFDRTCDHGDEFCDGYVYPLTENILHVLDELDAADVEYDNIDVPSRLLNMAFLTELKKRYPPQCGVALTLGDDHGIPIDAINLHS